VSVCLSVRLRVEAVWSEVKCRTHTDPPSACRSERLSFDKKPSRSTSKQQVPDTLPFDSVEVKVIK